MPAFLVLGKHVPDPRSLRSRRDVLSLGRVVADAEGNGHLEFVVPKVKPGAYQIVVFCPECAAFSAGRNVLPVASFRVVSMFQLPVTGSSIAAATLILAFLAMGAGTLTIVLSRRAKLIRPPGRN